MNSENSGIDKESLLTEYKLAQEMHIYIGKTIWQIGSIFYGISIASFTYGIGKKFDFLEMLALVIIISGLLIGQIIYSRRNQRLADMYIRRCVEIESIPTLNLKQHSNKFEADDKGKQIAGKFFEKQSIWLAGSRLNQIIPSIILAGVWFYWIVNFLICPQNFELMLSICSSP